MWHSILKIISGGRDGSENRTTLPQERLSMSKIREVLRLKHSQLSERAISRSCRISHSTVHEYLKRATCVGLSLGLLPEDLDEEHLYTPRLYPEDKQAALKVAEAIPDFKKVHEELKKRNVTLRLLWTEYRETCPQGYGYSQYCELYRRYTHKLDPPMRLHHKAGRNYMWIMPEIRFPSRSREWRDDEVSISWRLGVRAATLMRRPSPARNCLTGSADMFGRWHFSVGFLRSWCPTI